MNSQAIEFVTTINFRHGKITGKRIQYEVISFEPEKNGNEEWCKIFGVQYICRENMENIDLLHAQGQLTLL